MAGVYNELLRIDEDHPDVDFIYVTPKIAVVSDKNDVSRLNEILLDNHQSSTFLIFDLTEQQTGTCLLVVPFAISSSTLYYFVVI